MNLKYSRTLYLFATMEEVEGAVCDFASESAGGVLLYLHDHPRVVAAIPPEECRQKLIFRRLLEGRPDWAILHLYLKKTLFSATQIESLAGRQPYQRGLVTLQVAKPIEGRVNSTYLGVKVDESLDGPLPSAEDPKWVFEQLKKRLLRHKVPGTFSWASSSKPIRNHNWTEGAYLAWQAGAELFADKVQVLARTP